MPRIRRNQLEDIRATALHAAGAPETDARLVADHLVDNDAIGRHSHGVLRLREYVYAIDRGELIPSAGPRIVAESACTAQIDGIELVEATWEGILSVLRQFSISGGRWSIAGER